ncbi:MAG: hypothetical protein J4F31_05480 [Flavobacteriales bacterium]|nr:hypothetical protein [Flavobacteriales bacterium]
MRLVTANELSSTDTMVHSPKTALLRSLAVPGLGQAYNKKYWKIPIIYAALGTSVYFIIDNNRQYNEFKQAYIDRQDGIEDDYPQYTDDNLITLIDFYRRNRDFSVILTAGIYMINLLDAMVDAHLYEFDVSDELSIKVSPHVQFTPQSGYNPSVGFTLKF